MNLISLIDIGSSCSLQSRHKANTQRLHRVFHCHLAANQKKIFNINICCKRDKNNFE
jgi:hypothetical protein